jgi:hypothetical protein
MKVFEMCRSTVQATHAMSFLRVLVTDLQSTRIVTSETVRYCQCSVFMYGSPIFSSSQVRVPQSRKSVQL